LQRLYIGLEVTASSAQTLIIALLLLYHSTEQAEYNYKQLLLTAPLIMATQTASLAYVVPTNRYQFMQSKHFSPAPLLIT
jgi:hypothetical protein